MLKRLLALDGVMAVCQFRDDGQLVQGYGMGGDEMLGRLAKFALDYKRMVQGNADQLAMFTQMSGWTPPGGWIVRGQQMSVCSIANIACVIDMRETTLNTIMAALKDAASW
jgi:roadblock/LC7 domain-containing protein